MTTQPTPTPAPGNSNNPDAAAAPQPAAKTMDAIVALCRRRGFVFQSSEIYGGINGFWDYGPLGVELKRNLKDAWWHDIVRAPGKGPNGNLIEMVGVDCTIIMNPKVWVASGHVGGFSDPMVDCKESKKRYRADHIRVVAAEDGQGFMAAYLEGEDLSVIRKAQAKVLDSHPLKRQGGITLASDIPLTKFGSADLARIIGPDVKTPGTLTEPRQFNLMFQTSIGALQSEDSQAYLRPETAQGIFANFRNVVDTSRVKIPFGIAQVGKAFRNEVTPRNFTFRSREFEQMEIEFFIHPDSANEWYRYWRDSRFAWWQSIGLSSENLQLREHDRDELAHYAKEGAGTSDIEYRFPFTSPGFGELEGVAHRTDFDLKQHAEHSGLKDKLKYFDQELQVKLQNQGVAKEEIQQRSKYFPHVIEPSAGADRGTLALICEAYTPDPSRASGVYMKFHPRMAPVKAGIFPLVNKDGMSEVGESLYLKLRQKYAVEFDEKQSIGKRYARMDEAGAPYCFTIDGDTLTQQTVTVRHRDTQQQERVSLDKVEAFLAEKIG
jgi:glycyl-tRNA synthetase